MFLRALFLISNGRSNPKVTNWWMDKWYMMKPHSATENENLGKLKFKLQKPSAKPKKSDAKLYLVYEFIYMKRPGKQIYGVWIS